MIERSSHHKELAYCTHLNQCLDSPLDCNRIWTEPRRQLSGDFVDKVNVPHTLSVFHDTDSTRLEKAKISMHTG